MREKNWTKPLNIIQSNQFNINSIIILILRAIVRMEGGLFVDILIHVTSDQVLTNRDTVVEALNLLELRNLDGHPNDRMLCLFWVSLAARHCEWEDLHNGSLLSYRLADIIKVKQDFRELLSESRKIIDESIKFREHFFRYYIDIKVRSIPGQGRDVSVLLFPHLTMDEAFVKMAETLRLVGLEISRDSNGYFKLRRLN